MKLKFTFFATLCMLIQCYNIEGISQTVTDIDGNVYNTVTIGNQVWMAENLRVTHAPDERDIFYFEYNDDSSDALTFGRLYEWTYAMHTSTEEGAQGICPDGWHIPSDAEWNELATTLGGANIAGGKMKTTGNEYFLSPNTGATNTSGFNARAAGEWDGAKYWLRGKYSIYWSSTSTGDNTALYRYLSYQDRKLTSYDYYKNLAYSVRCVKNQSTGISDINQMFNNSTPYPNPFNDFTRIKITQAMTKNYKLRVCDINGKNLNVESKLIQGELIIKRAGLKNGIYFFSVTGGNDEKITGKLVVE